MNERGIHPEDMAIYVDTIHRDLVRLTSAVERIADLAESVLNERRAERHVTLLEAEPPIASRRAPR